MAGEKMMMREDQQQAVLFAAGIAALMACFEKAVIGVWAFLALNLLLLAILLTSKSLFQSDHIAQEKTADFHHSSKVVCRKSMAPPVEVDSGSVTKSARGGDNNCVFWECAPMEDDDDVMLEEGEDELSKEELNRRVEAFIASFRRHLVSDHVKGRRKQLGVRP